MYHGCLHGWFNGTDAQGDNGKDGQILKRDCDTRNKRLAHAIQATRVRKL